MTFPGFEQARDRGRKDRAQRPEQLRFHRDQGGMLRCRAQFYHRDGRLWLVTYCDLAGTGQHALCDQYGSLYCKYGCARASGCRFVQFLGRSRQAMFDTLQRFANLPVDEYGLLVNDAAGTCDQPQPPIVEAQVGGQTIRVRPGLQLGTVRLLPTEEDVSRILASCCTESTCVISETVEPRTEPLPRPAGLALRQIAVLAARGELTVTAAAAAADDDADELGDNRARRRIILRGNRGKEAT